MTGFSDGAAAFVAANWCGLAGCGLSVGSSYVGGAVLGPFGGVIGEALGGALGRRIGASVIGPDGGVLGGRIGQGFGRRVFTGHPVDVATGRLYATETELVMGGPVPVVWDRYWLSSSDLMTGCWAGNGITRWISSWPRSPNTACSGWSMAG